MDQKLKLGHHGDLDFFKNQGNKENIIYYFCLNDKRTAVFFDKKGSPVMERPVPITW